MNKAMERTEGKEKKPEKKRGVYYIWGLDPWEKKAKKKSKRYKRTRKL